MENETEKAFESWFLAQMETDQSESLRKAVRTGEYFYTHTKMLAKLFVENQVLRTKLYGTAGSAVEKSEVPMFLREQVL